MCGMQPPVGFGKKCPRFLAYKVTYIIAINSNDLKRKLEKVLNQHKLVFMLCDDVTNYLNIALGMSWPILTVIPV